MEILHYVLESGVLSLKDTGNIFIYISPNESEIKHIADKHNIDEFSLTSALDPDELARVDFEEDYIEIILKRPTTASNDLIFRVNSVGLFLKKDQLIIVLPQSIPLFKSKHYIKILTLKELMLKMIYSSISHFTGHLKTINEISNDIEDQVNTSMQNKYLLNLFSLEKSLVYYLNAINSNGVLIERLKHNASKMQFNDDEKELLDYLYIENNQCYKQAEIYSNILASLMDARASIVSNNLNWLMKTLTIITIAIMMPTLIVSIFSMNVALPLKDHPFAFWIILAIAVCSVFVIRLIWWWKRW